jgi:hypothetical protein
MGFFKELGDLFVDIVDGTIDLVEDLFDDDDDSYDSSPNEDELAEQKRQQRQHQQQQLSLQHAKRQCLQWARAHKVDSVTSSGVKRSR